MKRCLLLFLVALNATVLLSGKDQKVASPDGKTVLTVSPDPKLTWKVSFEGKEVMKSSGLALVLDDGRVLPAEAERVRKATTTSLREVIKPEVAYKRSEVPNNCNILELAYRSGITVEFRVYDDGVAYRFRTSFRDELTVKNEVSVIEFEPGSSSWYPLEDGFMSHNERIYIDTRLDTLGSQHLASLPALFISGGVNVLVTESDIIDYPGMWLKGAGPGKLTGVWPQYPEEETLRSDRDEFVTKTGDYIARTAGSRTFPWRVFIMSGDDGGLIESDMVYRLATPCQIADPQWIKPGKVAWDWWNDNNIYGVDFRAGINNDTYKHYIDFASENGLDYIILDEGWYRKGTVLEPIPDIDVPELCRYAESRNVGVILWVIWKTFHDSIDEAVALYEKWGVKGIKVDFMQRDDQKMVNFYHETARKAAEHHLLVDFHGAYKPDGMGRTWPNALTREGVKGLENCKWSRDITPDHNLMLPFIRMVAGPMDYTPGAMTNMERRNFTPSNSRPASQGTRAHQMALYVIYESPLQMLSDSPSQYRKEQECTSFISGIPVVWDDIRVLDAKIGDYLLMARRSGDNWYVGALTDWTPREMQLDLSFLPAGRYNVEVFSDGVNADRYAEDYRHSETEAGQGEKIKLKLAPGGGWVAKISPK